MQTNAKPINLPSSIAAYFEAATRDPDRVAQCFTERAVVIDERRERRGRAAVRALERRGDVEVSLKRAD